MKQFIIIPLFLLYANSQAAIKSWTPPADDIKHQVILTKLDGTIIEGTIISYTLEKITLLPATKKDIKKGNIYFPEVIPYYKIKSIKVLQWKWLLQLISAGLMFVLWLLIKGKLDPSSNEGLPLIILSPLMFIAALVGLLRKKKFNLNGNKEKYMYFLSRLKKFW